MRRKWPFIFPLILCISFFGLLVIRHQKKMAEKNASLFFEPKTWSEFGEYTRLQMLLKGFAIESLIDVPCMDIETLKTQELGIKKYIGVTELNDQARALQARFGSSLRSFVSFQVSVDVMPKVDLILCWDKLCTFSENDVRAALLQFKKSGTKFLLMRHYPEVEQNAKNLKREFQPVNWQLPPYNFPEPIIHIMDKSAHGMQSLSLWSLDSL